MTFQHPNSEPTGPAAGWYPDPVTGVGMRWWDGTAWTDHTTLGRPSEPGVADQSDHRPDGGLSAPGSWLGSSFRLVAKRAGHLFPLLVLLSLVPGIPVTIAFYFALKDVVLVAEPSWQSNELESISIEGFDAARLAPVIIALVVSLMASLMLSIATTLQVSRAADAQPERWETSLRRSLTRWPRVLGITILVGVIFALVSALFVTVCAVAAFLFPWALVLAVPAGVAGLLALGVRLSLATTAAALAPRGVGSVRHSFALTSGRVWPLIGRYCLLGIVLFGLQMAGSVLTAPFSAAIGPDVAGLEGSRLSVLDLMGGNLPLFSFLQLVSVLIGGCITALLSAGLVLLYRDLDGRTEAVVAQPIDGSDVEQLRIDEA